MRTSSEGKKHSIIEAQTEFRHPRQHSLQLDAAHNVTAHHTAVSIHLNKPHRSEEISQLNQTLSREEKPKIYHKI